MAKLLAAASLLSSAGCGGVGLKTREDAPLLQQLRVDSAFADDYFVDNLACQSGADDDAVAAFGTESVFAWQGDHTAATDVSFKGTSSVPSLRSAAIQASIFDFHQQQDCGNATSTAACNGAVKTVGQQKSLRICDAGKQFSRISVEGVALSGLANLNAARAFYATVPGASAAILPSYLLVLPTIEKVVSDAAGAVVKRSVSTDNLAYSANYGGSPIFVIYPKGKQAENDGLWKDLNLWEIPWGLAHEFGHHVFRTHTGVVKLGQSSAADRKENGLGDLLPIHAFPKDDDDQSFGLTDSHDVGGEDVFNAVNEGFADLFAYYVYGGKAGMTKNVDCFGLSRDVSSGDYGTGRAKTLDQEVVGTFFSKTALLPPAPCSTPSFQDVHAIGAIFAYAVDQIFDQKAPGDARAKAGLLIKWAEGIGEVTASLGAATNTLNFGQFVDAALAVVATSDAKGLILPESTCTIVNERFPALSTDLIGKKYRCQ